MAKKLLVKKVTNICKQYRKYSCLIFGNDKTHEKADRCKKQGSNLLLRQKKTFKPWLGLTKELKEFIHTYKKLAWGQASIGLPLVLLLYWYKVLQGLVQGATVLVQDQGQTGFKVGQPGVILGLSGVIVGQPGVNE